MPISVPNPTCTPEKMAVIHSPTGMKYSKNDRTIAAATMMTRAPKSAASSEHSLSAGAVVAGSH
jgi:hypothetical protein